jgi:hypothetical protein
MRGLLKLVEDLRRRNKNYEYSEGAKKIFSATQGIKRYRDLFDLDLVQLSCLGAFVNEKKFPVIMITADNKEMVYGRVSLFKSTFDYFNSQAMALKIVEKNSSIFEEIEILEGKIAFVDKNEMEILDIVDVSNIPILS